MPCVQTRRTMNGPGVCYLGSLCSLDQDLQGLRKTDARIKNEKHIHDTIEQLAAPKPHKVQMKGWRCMEVRLYVGAKAAIRGDLLEESNIGRWYCMYFLVALMAQYTCGITRWNLGHAGLKWQTHFIATVGHVGFGKNIYGLRSWTSSLRLFAQVVIVNPAQFEAPKRPIAEFGCQKVVVIAPITLMGRVSTLVEME
ncbi:hypothetical protein H0H81_011514 [Sphagnurus paluster]|uniref:Uncharacterized protein n=1 Tax=Sphagnurus paluster TaxID=117069 RepID=A0A9P7GPD0_9AGAR|nr:hypothetical protein H0H81_011514 [Sphagnurus paluster]